MDFYTINNIKLDIGLDRTYRIIQISDSHAISLDENQKLDKLNQANNNENAWYRQKIDFANYFHERYDEKHHHIPSVLCLEKLIEYINTNRPEIAILTGDIIDYYSKANYEILKKMLEKIEVPFIFTCGNHEAPASKFSELSIDNDVSFQCVDIDNLRFIGLDDSSKKISYSQLKRLKEKAEDGKKCIICMHIPILTKDNEKLMEKYDPYFVIDYRNCDEPSKEFIDYVCKNDNITTILCGHAHGYSTNTFYNNKKKIICSSGIIGFINDIKAN